MADQEKPLPVALRTRREVVIDALSTHFANDALDVEEFEQRLDSVHRATSVAELDDLLLPQLGPGVTEVKVTSVMGGIGGRLRHTDSHGRWRALATLRVHWVAGLATAALTLGPPVAACSQQDVWRLDVSGPVTYFIAEGSAEAGSREGDRTLAQWALEAWGRQAEPPLDMVPGPEASATIRVYWVPAGAGLYGEMRARRVEGRLAADVFVHPDTDGLGLDIAERARLDPLFRDAVVYLTCVHELGHAFGLPHTSAFADIMYSFQYGGDFVAYFMRFREKLEAWDDIQRASPFSTADGGTFRSLYR